MKDPASVGIPEITPPELKDSPGRMASADQTQLPLKVLAVSWTD
jgi:hypothetical protein